MRCEVAMDNRKLSYKFSDCPTLEDPLRPLTTGSYLAVQFLSLEALPTVIHICLRSALTSVTRTCMNDCNGL